MNLQDRLLLAMRSGGRKSQAGLARACGIKPPSVNDWFTGKTKSIDGKYLTSAARYLGVDPHWLSTGRGQMVPSDAGSHIVSEPAPSYAEPKGAAFEVLTAEEIAMLQDYRAMMDDDRTELRSEISRRAARIRAHLEKLQQQHGLPLIASAAAKAPGPASVSVPVGPRLQQKSLLDDDSTPEFLR